MAKIILAGLEWRTQQDLSRVLTGQGHDVTVGWHGAAAADALFCSADDIGYPELVLKVRTVRPDLPVIAVTALPEQVKWLDALEGGAADYCCAPFETAQLSCLLAGVLGHAPAKPTQLRRV